MEWSALLYVYKYSAYNDNDDLYGYDMNPFRFSFAALHVEGTDRM